MFAERLLCAILLLKILCELFCTPHMLMEPVVSSVVFQRIASRGSSLFVRLFLRVNIFYLLKQFVTVPKPMFGYMFRMCS